LEGKGVVNKDL